MPSAPRAPRLVALAVAMMAAVGCDQAAKLLARVLLVPGQPRECLGGVLLLAHVRNPGAFLGLGGGLPEGVRFALFTGLNSLVVLGGLGWLLLRAHLPLRRTLPVFLVVAGALGNQIDRLAFHGLVTDFLQLRAGPLRTGVFNLADVAIVAGAALGLLGSFRGRGAALEGPLP